MARTALHIKVELEHSEDERAEKLASEISRALLKIYGVRAVEISNIITDSD